MNLAEISKLGVKNPFKERTGGKFLPSVND